MTRLRQEASGFAKATPDKSPDAVRPFSQFGHSVADALAAVESAEICVVVLRFGFAGTDFLELAPGEIARNLRLLPPDRPLPFERQDNGRRLVIAGDRAIAAASGRI